MWTKIANVLNKKYVAISLVHTYIAFLNDGIFFSKSILNYPSLSIIRILSILTIWQAIPHVITKYKLNQDYRSAINHSLTYFAINMTACLFIWPGIWILDELRILESTKYFQLNHWQHYITNAFYYLSLLIFPTPAMIIIMQIACISLLAGYIISNATKLLNNNILTLALYIPLTLPPTIYMNLLPLRMATYAYISLFFITKLAKIKHDYPQKPSTDIWTLAIAASILITLRSEGIIYILILPLSFIYITWNESNKKDKTKFCLSTCFISTLLFIPHFTNMDKEQSLRYEITGYLRPLENLITIEKAEQQSQLLTEINKHIDIKDTAQGNLFKLFWENKLLRDSYFTLGHKALKSAYIELIKKYPKHFTKERIKLFMTTPYIVPIPESRDIFFKNLFKQNSLSWYTDKELYDKTYKLITNTKKHYIVYSNVIPILILLLTAIFTFKSNRLASICILITLARVPFTILTAPTNLFWYYFPTYITAYICVAIIIANYTKHIIYMLTLKRNRLSHL